MGAIDDAPRWRGVNHIALTTNDMDSTVRFYHEVLGMALVATIAMPGFKHYFFEIGPGNTIAFFEYLGHDVGTINKPAGLPPDFPTQFDHLSFNLADEAALEQLRQRLDRYECEVTKIVDHGIVRSIYFTDPNGIALEASYWVSDPTARSVDYADSTLMFLDSEPVSALKELISDGELAWTPQTSLAPGDKVVDPA